MNIRKYYQAIFAVLALGLIAAGCWLVYPPAAFMVVGMLLWLDLNWTGSGGRKK